MKLQFNVLIVDDEPDSIHNSLEILREHLERNGFSMTSRYQTNSSREALVELARNSGKEFDLVIVDYNLGGGGRSGAEAVNDLRKRLRYTDMIFYSSDPGLDLYHQLAEKRTEGVFIASRQTLGESLLGLADTVIGKAIDLNHMRGIAMAEVAEMDVLMEETLLHIFSATNGRFSDQARSTLESVKESLALGAKNFDDACLVDGAILQVVANGHQFSSAHKYFAIRRAAKLLRPKPQSALDVLATYEADIIHQRNTLAHAKEVVIEGKTALRASKPGAEPISIDEDWMVDFRGKLRRHRTALTSVCDVLVAHANGAT